MFVGDRMSFPVITVHPDLQIQEALHRMHKENVRRFPVVDQRGHLVGIVSEKDLVEALPSDATSLSIFELHELLHKITVEEIMTKNVITVDQDTPIEDAARLMADHKIGGLPVIRNRDVVGIITETDLFKIFLELMGAHEHGLRVSILVPGIPEELARLTRAIYENGGHILTLGTFMGFSSENREVLMTVAEIDDDKLREAIEPFVEQIIDIRVPHFA
ncbi:MAG: CBS domain-containing protein [Anaerolineales bacterium]|jgi:acetoin utilization protein AcuB